MAIILKFEDETKLAEELYRAGDAVVLKYDSGHLIHGGEELANVGPDKCQIVLDLSVLEWNASENCWQQLLTGARLGWLKNKGQ
ncbi:MAG TPA: hypothetical protein VK709_12265 [Candidatus Saccharimonadales bacterium]|jgi:hypothetical protein|nr:hypothetical protein [Candidatus Saccharimonadales bacterium]